MGDEVIIKEIQYLYPDSDRPLWQIDLTIKRVGGEVLYERLFVEPKKLDDLLKNAKNLAIQSCEDKI